MTETEVTVLPLEAEIVESLKKPKRSTVQAYKKLCDITTFYTKNVIIVV
jgi:hypothetical protein